MTLSRLRIDEEVRAIEERCAARSSAMLSSFVVYGQHGRETSSRLCLKKIRMWSTSLGTAGARAASCLHSDAGTDVSLVSSAALATALRGVEGQYPTGRAERVLLRGAGESHRGEDRFCRWDDRLDRGRRGRGLAAAFYRGLAYGKSVQTAFDLGLNELAAHGVDG